VLNIDCHGDNDGAVHVTTSGKHVQNGFRVSHTTLVQQVIKDDKKPEGIICFHLQIFKRLDNLQVPVSDYKVLVLLVQKVIDTSLPGLCKENDLVKDGSPVGIQVLDHSCFARFSRSNESSSIILVTLPHLFKVQQRNLFDSLMAQQR
jgi:hypothetical protein